MTALMQPVFDFQKVMYRAMLIVLLASMLVGNLQVTKCDPTGGNSDTSSDNSGVTTDQIEQALKDQAKRLGRK